MSLPRFRHDARRSGVVLLVVIALLTLFAVVGIAFVLFAQSEATASRVWRESETMQRPDMDPEMLLAHTLGQIIYGADDQNGIFSALRGQELSRSMFGYNYTAGASNTTPFNGVGRLHYQAPFGSLGNQDNFVLLNHQYFGADGFLRDPERYGSRAGPSAAPGPFVGGFNVSYTYPDINNPFLAAVRASDGAVLIQSYNRGVWTGFGSMDPSNPNWTSADPTMKYKVLRPRPADHMGFPPPEDAGGDVKQLANSPGYLIPGSNPPQFANNDSFWMYTGFPVMKAPDGRKFTALFAILMQDLDNRVNVNVAGNVRGSTTGAAGGLDPQNGITLSDQGLGPWEVNPELVLTAMEGANHEARRLFIGNTGVQGRYDLNFWGFDSHRLPYQYSNHGSFSSPTNYDANYPSMGVSLPGFGAPPASCFPYYSGNYDGGVFASPCRNHPLLYNFFMPAQSYYYPGPQDRAFGVGTLEALLRYGDRGSPALTSDLFRCCPLSLASAKARRLVTTHSFDLMRPGATPWVWDPTAQATQYALNPITPSQNQQQNQQTGVLQPQPPDSSAGGIFSPSGGPIPFPTWGTPLPANSEFTPDWRAVSAALGRINLNRVLPDYPTPQGNPPQIADLNSFNAARAARQQLAMEIFTCLQQVTGAASPASVAPTMANPYPPQYNALRWLAQLSVNIVDLLGNYPRDLTNTNGTPVAPTSDYMTPFNWYGTEWVYGTVLPRLVANEAYVEVANDPTDPLTGGKATMPFKVSFWVEVYNPFYPGDTGGGSGGAPSPTEGGNARLQMPPTIAGGGNPGATPPNGYPVYQLVIAQTPNLTLRGDPTNVTGNADAAQIKTVVADYSPETAPTPQPGASPPLPAPVNPMFDPNVVLPSSGATSGPNGQNKGYYVLGPKYDFPGTDPNKPIATLRVKDQQITVNGQQQRSSMVYELPLMTDFTKPLPKHTLLLRRLTCPYLPPQTDPTKPNYNPYVTVDYMDQVPTNDGIANDANGMHMNMVQVTQRSSVGRMQPYAADQTQQKPQAPPTPSTKGPQTTMFSINAPVSSPFDWLVSLDRPLVSPMELLQVSAFKPHELTQQFVTMDNTGTTQKFSHRAPWFDPNARIYRLFEFLEGGCPMQWAATGGRTAGRVNINNIWDVDTFMALCDPKPNNFFTSTDVTTMFQNMLATRSPAGAPGANDRPFRGFADAFTAAGDTQYPQGVDINDTFLRSDPTDPNPNPVLKRRLFELPNPPASANGHPYIKYELMKKVSNNFTTRSNVFAVWITAGFFEVMDDSDPTRPPKLGKEIGRSENRHVRHRMFAVVDRSNLSVSATNQTQIGPRPVFIPGQTAVVPNLPLPSPPTPVPTWPVAPGQTISVPGISGTYDNYNWAINSGDMLVVDVGVNQEIVKATVGGAPPSITANFTKPHGAGFAISDANSNGLPGNPGPQRQFDPRNPIYGGVVRYFSIIE